MSDNFNTRKTEDSKIEWLTPPSIIKALGKFDLDPCAPHAAVRPWPTADRHFSGAADLFSTISEETHCGLAAPWHGRVWLNPPYGDETFDWLEKLAAHRSGIGLIFARSDTVGFHKTVFNKARGLFFFLGRINFYNVDGTKGENTSPAPSCLVAYSDADCKAIEWSGLAGRYCFLGNGYADEVPL